jgi:hypothetical protein
MVKEEWSMFGSNGCPVQKAAVTFGRIRIGPIQMGSYTNGIKEDYRIELGPQKTNLGSDLLGWIRDAGEKGSKSRKGCLPA